MSWRVGLGPGRNEFGASHSSHINITLPPCQLALLSMNSSIYFITQTLHTDTESLSQESQLWVERGHVVCHFLFASSPPHDMHSFQKMAQPPTLLFPQSAHSQTLAFSTHDTYVCSLCPLCRMQMYANTHTSRSQSWY